MGCGRAFVRFKKLIYANTHAHQIPHTFAQFQNVKILRVTRMRDKLKSVWYNTSDVQ